MTRRRSVGIVAGLIMFLAVAAWSIMISAEQSNEKYTGPNVAAAKVAETQKPVRCEVRNEYMWTLERDSTQSTAAPVVAKGKSATVPLKVAAVRTLVSTGVWCGPAGSELAFCDKDSCPSADQTEIINRNLTATITADASCPAASGLECSTPAIQSTRVAESGEVGTTVLISNTTAACGMSSAVGVDFSLSTESESEESELSMTVPVKTQSCPKPAATPKKTAPTPPKRVVKPAKPKMIVVSRPVSYWQKNSDLLGNYLPVTIGGNVNGPRVVDSVSEAREILSYGNSEDGIWRLAAQLVIAKVNIRAGALVPTNACLGRGDALFDEHKLHVWRLLSAESRRELHSCADSLAAFNSRVVLRP